MAATEEIYSFAGLEDMKKKLKNITAIIGIVICLLTIPCMVFLEIKFPKPIGYVNDFAGVLSGEVKSSLENIANELESKTGAEVVVATIETTEKYSIEEYAVRLFEKWGIGKKGKDNGALLLVAVKDRALKIEPGYGMEGVLTDAICARIIRDNIVPHLKQNNFEEGIKQGVLMIISYIANDHGVTIEGVDLAGMELSGFRNTGLLALMAMLYRYDVLSTVLFMIFIVVPYILSVIARKNKKGKRTFGGWWGGGFSGGSFGGGFGRSGGGFGGFGGGLSGGGGAVGRF